jgi:hypothetical protein
VPDKVVVSNDQALQAKYGAQKSLIDAAVQKLIAADAQRGLTTVYIAVDSAASMQNVSGNAVASASDQQANKNAIDAIYNSLAPDYVVLLGAPDVIPHQELTNPVYNPPGDPDQVVPSDLPYACVSPYSQDPTTFVGPSRVVSRIPDLAEGNDSSYLVSVLDYASGSSPGNYLAYTNYLGVTAQVWAGSAQLSLAAIFGNSALLQQVPPAGYQWSVGQLQAMSHFFNCHGAPNDHRFYGQLGSSYPVAHDASYVVGKLHVGTVLAAECCYGAQLFDPSLNGGQMGMANTYLQQGGYGYFGSTTIAYGPADANANADLICQYYIQQILKGASVGRAGLAARQSFAQSAGAISPTDLKTLAQFLVLGDGSVQCIAPQSPDTETEAKYGFSGPSMRVAESRARKSRRLVADQVGFFLQHFKRVSDSRPGGLPLASLGEQLSGMAVRAGYRDPKIFTFAVREPAIAIPSETKAAEGIAPITAFHVVMESVDSGAPRGRSTRLLEAREANGVIVGVRELFSK